MGIELDNIKSMILLLVGLLVLISVVSFFFIKLQGTSEDATCKESVAAQAFAHVKGVGFAPEELKCPTKEITIKGSDKKDIKFQIAEQMRKCWNNFGEGKAELFDKEQIFCSVCANIDFAKKDMQVNGFTDYLARTKIIGDGRTYAEYLSTFKKGDLESVLDNSRVPYANQAGADTIWTDKSYSVVLVYVKGKNKIAQWKDHFGKFSVSLVAGWGVGLGTATGLTTLAVVLAASNPFGLIVTGTVIAGVSLASGVASFVTTFFAGENPQWVSMVLLKEYSKDQLSDMGCEYFPSIQGKS